MALSPAIHAIPLRRTATDVRDLLRGSLQVLRQQANSSDVGLQVLVDDDVPARLSVDRNKIAWAITTLVGNALRYVRHGSKTMPGGSIVVRASYDPVDREVAIDVEDDGPGIAAERLSSLLDDTTEAGGSALGLAMIKDVVVAHRGTIRIDSDATGFRHGTTVRVTLPAGE
jgi:signal transduction histidine kinase